jgi:hypothetical protein
MCFVQMHLQSAVLEHQQPKIIEGESKQTSSRMGIWRTAAVHNHKNYHKTRAKLQFDIDIDSAVLLPSLNLLFARHRAVFFHIEDCNP